MGGLIGPASLRSLGLLAFIAAAALFAHQLLGLDAAPALVPALTGVFVLVWGYVDGKRWTLLRVGVVWMPASLAALLALTLFNASRDGGGLGIDGVLVLLAVFLLPLALVVALLAVAGAGHGKARRARRAGRIVPWDVGGAGEPGGGAWGFGGDGGGFSGGDGGGGGG